MTDDVLRIKGARERKAFRIAAALLEHDFTPDQAESMDAEQRDLARQIAGTHPPSDATWEMVVGVMRTIVGDGGLS